jgi:steroid delta-isomerase-like uncharacterized protein
MKKARAKKRPAARPRLKKSTARPVAAIDSAKTRKLARRWFDELWNKRNGDALPRLMHTAAVGDTEGGMITGHAEFYYKLHGPLLAAFPDLKVTIDGIVAEEADAVVRWTMTATHAGDMMGIQASNRKIRVGGMSWLRFDTDGKVIAGWDRWNAAGLFAGLRSGVSSATVKVE